MVDLELDTPFGEGVRILAHCLKAIELDRV
jgi:hypothetical protein